MIIKTMQRLSVFGLCLLSSATFATPLQSGHAFVQLGGFSSHQGRAQFVPITGLIGDTFTVTHHHDSNALVGLGYLVNGPVENTVGLAYGINAFYFPKISVGGRVIQESLFNNLSYSYNVIQLPVYAEAKITINPNQTERYALTFDAGIGPNFIKTTHFAEHSLDNITPPDNAYSGYTKADLSAMGGIGVRINNVLFKAPLECGYRFFYLGQGRLSKNTDQLASNLNTGHNYANALICSLTV